MDGVEIKVGECGPFIKEHLDAAEDRIIVVSPWLSQGYAKMLLEKKEEGVDVAVHTTEDRDTGNHLLALNSFIEENKVVKSRTLARKYGKIISMFSGLSAVALLVFELYIVALAMVMILVLSLILYYIGREKTETTSDLKIDELSIYPDTLHSKIYVFDDIAIIGSANFTYTGFNENLETVVKIEEDELLDDILEQIEGLSLNRKF